jgi:hypothetical protein
MILGDGRCNDPYRVLILDGPGCIVTAAPPPPPPSPPPSPPPPLSADDEKDDDDTDGKDRFVRIIRHDG